MKGQDRSQETFRKQKGGDGGLHWGGNGGGEWIQERCWAISGYVARMAGWEVVPLAKAVALADVRGCPGLVAREGRTLGR